jgi:hypothetical protein
MAGMADAATTTTKSKTRRKWPRWVVWTAWSLLGVLAVVGVISLATLWFGAVHGVELNPYTLARRSYFFYEIPLIRWQIRGIKREEVTSVLADELERDKYVPPAKTAPNVWHLVTGSRGVRGPTIGDADILVRYLEAKDAKDVLIWYTWSEQHPKLAKILWPAVSRLAQEEEYVHVPELFDIAAGATDPVALQASLNRKLAERLLELSQRLTEAEHHAEAKKYLDEAKQLDRANSSLLKAADQSKQNASLSAPAPQ